MELAAATIEANLADARFGGALGDGFADGLRGGNVAPVFQFLG